ncbi:ATP-binding protein, partial [Aeromonas veronii]
PVTRKARDVFRSAIHGTLEPQELNFDVTVFEWTRPHPKVPAVDPNYNFMAKDLYEILWCVENGKNAVLVGPPGCGKTVATEQLAARLG